MKKLDIITSYPIDEFYIQWNFSILEKNMASWFVLGLNNISKPSVYNVYGSNRMAIKEELKRSLGTRM